MSKTKQRKISRKNYHAKEFRNGYKHCLSGQWRLTSNITNCKHPYAQGWRAGEQLKKKRKLKDLLRGPKDEQTR